MQFAFLCIVCIAGPALVGAIVSLIALLPPIQRMGRNSAESHCIKSGVLALVAFCLVLGGYTGIVVELLIQEMVDDSSSCCAEDPNYVPLEDVARNINALRVELWNQMMLPPSISKPCILGNTEPCEIATTMKRKWGGFDPLDSEVYFAMLFAGLVAATVTYSIVWSLTRPTESLSIIQTESDSDRSSPPQTFKPAGR